MKPLVMKSVLGLLGVGAGFLGGMNLSLAVLSSDYQELSASDKRQQLWHEINQDLYSELPHRKIELSDQLNLIGCPWKQAHAFTENSDLFPVGVPRRIHKDGAAAQFRWIPSGQTEYTGVFASGGIGILRASLGVEGMPYTPGLGVKVLVDGHPSVNFHLMYSLDGQGENTNYFENSLSNHLPFPGNLVRNLPLGISFLSTIKLFMERGPESPLRLPLEEAASIQSNGEVAQTVVAPFQLIFVPDTRIKRVMNPQDPTDLRVQLQNRANFEQGVVLYHVQGRSKDSEALLDLGKVVLESPFISSESVDTKLFFKHEQRL